MNKFIKSLIVSTSLLGLGLLGTNTAHHAVHVPVTMVQAHASENANQYWTNRINRYASTRGKYFYPKVTYNTRDLGGMQTADGKYAIRPHMLYRSANLHSIKQSGANQIKRLNIKQDIDLRAQHGPNNSITAKPQPGEKANMPDRYRIGMHYHNYPVENSAQEQHSWGPRKKHGEQYRFGYYYTNNPVARRAYHNSIMFMIRNHSGNIMFNCTQGRDRTGVLAAITEYLLGINKWNIYNDFMLTNHYKYQSPYTNQVLRINRFYSTVARTYGSMWHYCRRGLSLSYYDIKLLRNRYLMPVRNRASKRRRKGTPSRHRQRHSHTRKLKHKKNDGVVIIPKLEY